MYAKLLYVHCGSPFHILWRNVRMDSTGQIIFTGIFFVCLAFAFFLAFASIKRTRLVNQYRDVVEKGIGPEDCLIPLSLESKTHRTQLQDLLSKNMGVKPEIIDIVLLDFLETLVLNEWITVDSQDNIQLTNVGEKIKNAYQYRISAVT